MDPLVCLFVYKQEKLTHVGRTSLSIDKELPLMSRLGLVDPIVFTLDFEKKPATNTSTWHSDMKVQY